MHYRQMLGQEIQATEAVLGSLSRVVEEMQARVDTWSAHALGGVTDQLFVIESIRDLGRLKQRSDAAIKQLVIHVVRDRGVPASTVARELGVAHTTVTIWQTTGIVPSLRNGGRAHG